MKSPLAERLGSQKPVVLHEPPDVHSLAAAEEAIELADAYAICDGHPLAESQKITLRAGLGEREDGTWAATRIADFGPRQGTGKNDKIAARELAGLILFGERLIIHTAHEFPTANESFLRLVSIFENYDDLRKRVARIRYANGEQGIELLSGQRLKYRARTGGSGRGFAKADLIVYDEAQHLGREHIAASGPAKLANPNSQTWYAGSGGLASSTVAWKVRRDAILGAGGRLAYTEMTAEQIAVVGNEIITSAPPADDIDAWYQAMPGLGRWVTEEGMRALYDELGPELFARECLCVWDPEPTDDSEKVIPQGDWDECFDKHAERGDRFAYAVDVAEDGAAATIAASDGTVVRVIEWNKGSRWLPERLAEVLKDRPAPVWLNDKGPTGALLGDLAGIKWQPITGTELAQACGSLRSAVTETHTLRHSGQPTLDIAVANCSRKNQSDAWVWDRRKSTVDISPLIAVTIARWAALQGGVPPAPMFAFT